MLSNFFPDYSSEIVFIGLLFAFLATCVLIELLKNVLPRDGGRAFAVNGALSQGKPRGLHLKLYCLIFTLSTGQPRDHHLLHHDYRSYDQRLP